MRHIIFASAVLLQASASIAPQESASTDCLMEWMIYMECVLFECENEPECVLQRCPEEPDCDPSLAQSWGE